MRTAILALALLAAPAAAEPAPEEYAIWSAEYGERYDRWYEDLLFDTDLYFHEGAPAGEGATTNLVDVKYSIARKRFGAGWAFAVEMQCPDGPPGEPVDRSGCKPVLRIAGPKPEGTAAPEWLADFLPRSREDMARILGATADWREADLRNCPAAVEQLVALRTTMPAFWPSEYLGWLQGVAAAPDTAADKADVAVVADGDGIELRARTEIDPARRVVLGGEAGYFVRQWNGGSAYDWAKAMHSTVEPCLAPSDAPPPWEKGLLLPEIGN